jgi:hypothetical protein
MRKFILALILIGTCTLLSTHGVFAADGTTTADDGLTALKMLSMVLGLMSRWWTVMAVLAGKLMSNDWVYGTGLHLDKVLYVMWNYMKNIANFTLGFYFLYNIIKSLFGKAFAFKTEIGKFVLAWVLINMSWFAMGALVDLANVATAAVGAFPAALMKTNITQQTQFQEIASSIPVRVDINMNQESSVKPIKYKPQEDLSKIRSSLNDMSGPLLFLGAWIVRLQDYDINNLDVQSLKNFSIGQILKLIISIMFFVPLTALFLVNLKRIFYMRIRIIFAPIIVLINVFSYKVKGELSKGTSLESIFNIKEIIGMIFQPVLTIGGMAIVLILSTGMYSALWGTPGQWQSGTRTSHVIGSAEISTINWSSTFSNNNMGTDITFDGDLFADVAWYAGGFIGYLIICAFTILLLWAVVKMSMAWSSLAKGTFDSISKLATSAVGNASFIPIGWGRKISLATVGNSPDIVKWMGDAMNRNNQDISSKALTQSVFGTKDSAKGKFFKEFYNIGDDTNPDITKVQEGKLLKWLTDSKTIKEVSAIIKTSSEGATLSDNSSGFKNAIQSTILKNNGLRTLISSSFNETITDNANLFDTNTSLGKKMVAFVQAAVTHGADIDVTEALKKHASITSNYDFKIK